MTTILIKKKDTAGAPAAGDLTNAAGGTEIAVNTATRRIYTKDSGGNVVELGTNASSSTIADLTVTNSTTLSYGTANQVQFLNASKLLVGSGNMTFNGTRLTVADLADAGLTAGRVTYASTGGALVDSANLTFDGTNLGVGGAAGNSTNYSTITARGTTGGIYEFNSGATLQSYILGNSSELRLQTQSTQAITFAPNGTEAMRLTSTGLGIGTSTVGARLTTQAAANSYVAGAFQINSLSATHKSYITNVGGLMLFSNSSTVDQLVLDSSGNLGLGVTPTGKAKFEVYTGVGAYAGISTRFNATNFPISFGVTNANGVPYFGVNARQVSGTDGQTYDIDGFASRMWCNGGGFAFFTAPSGTAGNAISFTQAMTLDASGNLGVGTSSPATILDVVGSGNPTLTLRGSAGAYTSFLKLQAAGGGGSVINATGATSDSLIFQITGTERARIDSSGNVGIGTSSPSARVDAVASIVALRASTAEGAAFFRQFNGSATSGITELHMRANAGKSTYITFTEDAIADRWSVGIQNGNDALRFIQGAPTTGTERARIDSSGNLLVGTTSTSSNSGTGFKVLANLGASGHFDPAVVTPSNNTSQSCWDIYSTAASGYRFYVTTSGVVNAVSTTISAISDQRLKENIRDLNDGLDIVMALKPRKFDWKKGKGADIKNARGFIAQEFEKVLPDLIDEWKDPAPEGEEPYKSVRADLIPVLVKAIQELKAEFDAYKASHP